MIYINGIVKTSKGVASDEDVMRKVSILTDDFFSDLECGQTVCLVVSEIITHAPAVKGHAAPESI